MVYIVRIYTKINMKKNWVILLLLTSIGFISCSSEDKEHSNYNFLISLNTDNGTAVASGKTLRFGISVIDTLNLSLETPYQIILNWNNVSATQMKGNNSEITSGKEFYFDYTKSETLWLDFSADQVASYTINVTISNGNVTKKAMVMINVAEVLYQVELLCNESEGIVSGAGNYIKDKIVVIEAQPKTGYSFVGWYEGGTLISTVAKYTFKATTHTKLTASFSPNSGTIIGTTEEKRIITLVNQERAKVGLPPLKAHNSLMESAKIRAKEVKESQLMNHKRPDGSSYSTAIMIPVKGSGENITLGNLPENAMAAWMESTGHRNNILNKNYTHIGVGSHKFIPIIGGYAWIQIFAKIDE